MSHRLLVSTLLIVTAWAQQTQSPTANEPTGSFEELSTKAAGARDAGKSNDAIQLYRAALNLHSDWVEGWWYLGTLNYDADRYADAIAAFQSLLQLNPGMSSALAFLGLSEFEIKDYKNALDHLQQAQKVGYGDDAELAKVATYHLALLRNRSGDFDAATALLLPQIKQSRPPDDIKVVLGMALLRIPLLPSEVDPDKDALLHSAGEAAVQLAQGNAAQAADAVKKLLIEYPKTPYLHNAYAAALADAGKNEEARRELEANESAAAKKLNANDAIEAQRNLYMRASTDKTAPQPAIPSSTPAHPGDNFEALAQKASAAQKAGQTDPAVSYYQRALALRSDWDEGWLNLGTLCFVSGHYPDAIAALKNSAAISPRKGNVWALLGLAEFETRDYKNSRIHLERGNELGFAGNAAAIGVAKYHLAVLLNQAGEFDKATELLSAEAVSGALDDQLKLALGMALLHMPILPDELAPSNLPMVRLAGQTAAYLSESKYDQAFAGFQQLLKMNSSTPYLHYAYGTALASASRYDDAEEQLLAETKVTPASELPYLRRSAIALQLRNTDKAAKLAQQAIKIAPDSAEGHYLLGRSSLELGKTADALHELESARALAPNSPEVRFSLARAYSKAGQSDAAEHERTEFERLNRAVQNKRSQNGNQAYGAIPDQNGIRAAETSGQNESAAHPK